MGNCYSFAMVSAVRGATCVQQNCRDAIKKASLDLISSLLSTNKITERRIISIVFSVTEDLDAGNPASSIRTVGFKKVPLFCVQEAKCNDSLAGVIRVLITYRRFFPFGDPKPVYKGGAEVLRPDLSS